MNTRIITESAAFVGNESDEGLWPVCIIREGVGSSAVYTAEMLTENAAAFSGVLSFVNHPENQDEPWSRSILDVAGEIVGETWVETRDGVTGIYGNFKPSERYREYIEPYRDKIGLSIYSSADGSVNESGQFVVTEFDKDDPYRSVDVVIAPGAGGRFERLLESFKAQEEQKPSVGQAQEGKETGMDEKVLEALQALTEKLDSLVAEKEAKADASAIEAAAQDAAKDAVENYEAAVTAIEAADLLPSQVARLKESARAGVDVTEAIEAEKKIAAEARESVGTQNQAGRVHESTQGAKAGIKINGWGK